MASLLEWVCRPRDACRSLAEWSIGVNTDTVICCRRQGSMLQ